MMIWIFSLEMAIAVILELLTTPVPTAI